MVRVWDNAAAIAFYRGEKREHLDLISKFADIFENTTRLIGWNRNLAFFTTRYNYFSLILPTLVVALLYFTGKIQMDTVLQAGGAFAGVLAATSLIIAQFERLSGFAAGVTRIDALWTGLTEQDQEEERDIDIASTSSDEPGQIDVK